MVLNYIKTYSVKIKITRNYKSIIVYIIKLNEGYNITIVVNSVSAKQKIIIKLCILISKI